MNDLTFHEKLVAVQKELKAPKNQYNSFGKYKYRSLEDIMEAAKPLLASHSLTLVFEDEVISAAGVSSYPVRVKVDKTIEVHMVTDPLFIQARAILLDGEDGRIEVTACAGIDIDKSGMDMAQAFGAASSYARKYAANGLFLIDDTKDADSTNTHGKTSPANRKPAGPKKVDAGSAVYLNLHKRVKALPAEKRADAIQVIIDSPKYKLTKEAVNGLQSI
jgi:hypothetical protein